MTYSPEVVQCIIHGDAKDLRALRIDGYKLSDLIKCEDFGGKSDNGTVKEQYALNRFNQQIQTIRGSGFVPIEFRGVVHKVVGVVDTPGTPKSDFHLVNTDGEECIWISHKDGKSAKCFQQWGGISLRTEKIINQHPETQEFISQVRSLYPNGVPRATTVGKVINDTILQNLSVYGNEFGQSFSRQNVNYVIQGDVNLESVGENYRVSGSIVHDNGQMIAGSYKPIFVATLRNDRSNEGIPNTRLSIAPSEGRKITTWL